MCRVGASYIEPLNELTESLLDNWDYTSFETKLLSQTTPPKCYNVLYEY